MRNHEKHDEWSGIVEEWGRSGQKQKEFCASRGIAYSTFCYWKKQLEAEGRGAVDKDIKAVEVAHISPGGIWGRRWPSAGIEVDTQGIEIQIPGSDAKVTIVGRLSIEVVGRIIAACAEDGDRARA